MAAACPFCAGTDTEIIPDDDRLQVFCCGCGAAGPVADTEDAAWEAWGTRRILAAVRQAVQRIFEGRKP